MQAVRACRQHLTLLLWGMLGSVLGNLVSDLLKASGLWPL